MKSKSELVGLITGAAILAIVIFIGSQGSGYIKIETPGFETDLNLSGRWGSKEISVSSSEPVGIRHGTYKPEQIVVRLTKTSDQWWSIFCHKGPWGKLSVINVAKGKTTTLKLGPPFTMQTDIQRNGQTVSIGLSLVGQAGEQYSPQLLTQNGPLPEPTIKIADETGRELDSGKFEYG
jgi:hypothetical protein